MSWKQWSKGQILRGTKEIFGNRDHKKITFFFILGEQGHKPIYFQGCKGTGTTPIHPLEVFTALFYQLRPFCTQSTDYLR